MFEYRESMPVTGDHGIPSLGTSPIEAVERLKAYSTAVASTTW